MKYTDGTGFRSSGNGCNLISLLQDRALRWADKKAYVYLPNGDDETIDLTYAELDQRARAIAVMLQQKNMFQQRALLFYPSNLDYIVAFFGCLYAGVVAVPLYPPTRRRNLTQLTAIIENADPKVVLTDSSLVRIMKPSLSELPGAKNISWITTDTVPPSLAQSWYPPPTQPSDPIFLQYTSGSTGTPKGVVNTQENLFHNLEMMADLFQIDHSSCGVSWLPLYHDMGLIGGVFEPLYRGFTVILMSPSTFIRKPIHWLKAISTYRATVSGGPNFAFELCAKSVTPEEMSALDLSCWRIAFNGAEPVQADTIERFATAFAPCGFNREAFYPCYGMAEATLFIAGGQPGKAPPIAYVDAAELSVNKVMQHREKSPATRTIVGCGWTRMGQRIVIANPQTHQPCVDNEVGEIWLTGTSVARGYWRQPEETAQCFNARLSESDTETYLRTGDLGFTNVDGLFITGRLKDLIIIRGRNYYPEDIEHVVRRSHSALGDVCAAFTVENDGEEKIVLAQELDRHSVGKIDTQEVIATMRATVAKSHGLSVYCIVLLKPASIQRTSSGKIQRHLCRKSFLDRSWSVVDQDKLDDTNDMSLSVPENSLHKTLLMTENDDRRELLQNYIYRSALRIIQKESAADDFDPDTNLIGLGLDSLMIAKIHLQLERALGVPVPGALLWKYPTLSGLAQQLLVCWCDARLAENLTSTSTIDSAATDIQEIVL